MGLTVYLHYSYTGVASLLNCIDPLIVSWDMKHSPCSIAIFAQWGEGSMSVAVSELLPWRCSNVHDALFPVNGVLIRVALHHQVPEEGNNTVRISTTHEHQGVPNQWQLDCSFKSLVSSHQRKHQSPTLLDFGDRRKSTGDQRIPLSKGQWCRNSF